MSQPYITPSHATLTSCSPDEWLDETVASSGMWGSTLLATVFEDTQWKVLVFRRTANYFWGMDVVSSDRRSSLIRVARDV